MCKNDSNLISPENTIIANNSYNINYYIDNETRKYFTDFTLEKHQLSRPPNEAYLYFPTSESEFYEINESKVYRKIFSVKNFTDYENDILIKFECFLSNYNELKENRKIIFTDDWERWDTLKFLEAANYDFKKALQIIYEHLDWKNAYFPFDMTERAMEILTYSGFIYCHGRDHNYRPNIFIKMKIYFSYGKKYSFDEWQMALVFFFLSIL